MGWLEYDPQIPLRARTQRVLHRGFEGLRGRRRFDVTATESGSGESDEETNQAAGERASAQRSGPMSLGPADATGHERQYIPTDHPACPVAAQKTVI